MAEIVNLMKEEELDVMGLQETKRPYNDVMTVGDFIFVFSSDKEPPTGNNNKKEEYQFRNNKGKPRVAKLSERSPERQKCSKQDSPEWQSLQDNIDPVYSPAWQLHERSPERQKRSKQGSPEWQANAKKRHSGTNPERREKPREREKIQETIGGGAKKPRTTWSGIRL